MLLITGWYGQSKLKTCLTKVLTMTLRLAFFSLMLCLIFSFNNVSGQSATQEKPPEAKSTENDKDKNKDPKQLAKEADIRKLLVVTGAGKMGVQVMQQMLNSIKIQNPNIPSDYFDKLMQEADANELIEISIPSYDKHMTHDDIKELLKFYESPIGKKLIEKQPLILRDSMIAGQKWGMELNRRIQQRIKDDF